MRPNAWSVALVRWASELRGEPYEWGRTDCGSLAREAIGIVTGSDPFPETPAWTSPEAAKASLKALGGFQAAMEGLGAREVALAYAQSGDVARTPPTEEHPAHLAVIVAGRALVTTEEAGVHLVELSQLPERTVLWRLP